MNREQWLEKLATKAIPAISRGTSFPAEELSVKLSCGFPAQNGKRKPIAAQLIPPTASEEFNAEIFVTPTLAEKRKVAQAVLPLLVAVVTGDFKQRQNYRNALATLGLNGETLPLWATDIVDGLPAYPHAEVRLENIKKQTTRLIKVACLADGYIARVSRSTLENLGAPICPACRQSLTETN